MPTVITLQDKTPSMATARSGAAGVLLASGKFLMVAGQVTSAPTNTSACEVYDPVANTWTAAASYLQPVNFPVAARLPDGRVMALGGLLASGAVAPQAGIYDPVANTWTAVANYPVTNGAFGAVTPDWLVVLPGGDVLGGCGTDGALNPVGTLARYSVAANSWTVLAAVAMPRSNSVARLLADGRVLIAAGSANIANLPVMELFDPSTNKIRGTGQILTGRNQPAILQLPSGLVLLAGGTLGTDRPDLWNPATGRARQTGNAVPSSASTVFAAGQGLFTLPSGKVLMAAGVIPSGTSAAVYDPAADRWLPVSSLFASRSNYAGAVLPSGRVLVCGGTSGASNTVGCETYDEPSNAWSDATHGVPAAIPAAATSWQAQVDGAFVGNVVVEGSVSGDSAYVGLSLQVAAGGTPAQIQPSPTSVRFARSRYSAYTSGAARTTILTLP